MDAPVWTIDVQIKAFGEGRALPWGFRFGHDRISIGVILRGRLLVQGRQRQRQHRKGEPTAGTQRGRHHHVESCHPRNTRMYTADTRASLAR